MRWLERKYISIAGNRLTKFTKTSDDTWNFRCWFCGDSQKNKNKKRGYIYFKNRHYLYFCHNCNRSQRFVDVLKQIDIQLYNQYLFEKIQTETSEQVAIEQQKPKYHVDLNSLSKISSLKTSHEARQFITKRLIPIKYHSVLRYTPNFVEWTNSIIPNKFSHCPMEDKRVVIPLLTRERTCFGFQGRSIDPNCKTKYITIITDDTRPRIFGLNTIDFNKQYFCTEGPLDSTFIENSIASCGGVIQQELSKIPNEFAVAIYDNERRNKQIVAFMKRYATNGSIVVWPSNFQYKDINDYIMGEVSKGTPYNQAVADINNIVRENVHTGLHAQLAISQWINQ